MISILKIGVYAQSIIMGYFALFYIKKSSLQKFMNLLRIRPTDNRSTS